MGEDITELLQLWNAGDPGAVDRLAAELSDELRKLAASYMRGEREQHTLQPTALVNELYLRLVQRKQVDWKDRGHFFAFAARTLRRILVDHARKHRAEKRGGEDSAVTLEDHLALTSHSEVDVLDLNFALEQLVEEDPRLARVVELRYFGGLTLEEIAEVTEFGTATVKRDLKVARAFLLHRLKHRDGTEDAD